MTGFDQELNTTLLRFSVGARASLIDCAVAVIVLAIAQLAGREDASCAQIVSPVAPLGGRRAGLDAIRAQADRPTRQLAFVAPLRLARAAWAAIVDPAVAVIVETVPASV